MKLRIFFLGGIEYYKTGRGNKGLRIDGYLYKRHYETLNSVYWICNLSNKLKCKQRVIAEKGKPFVVRFKGPGHNHSFKEYQPLSNKVVPLMDLKSFIDADHIIIKSPQLHSMESDME